MSMSQEEIEALMNGLDISDDETDSEEASSDGKVNTQEIEELLSQNEDIKVQEDILSTDLNEDEKIENLVDSKEETSNVDEIPELIENSSEVESKEDPFDLDNLDDLLKNDSDTLVDNDDIDALLNDINMPTSSDTKKVEVSENENQLSPEIRRQTDDEIVQSWTSCKINEGVIPLPADKDTKVVNQLSQVANDSEEKVSQIFDVLSLSLDNNAILRNKIKEFEAFVTLQSKLLTSLNTKFPNISVFNDNLSSIDNVSKELNYLKNMVNDEDNQIFQGMELMQFNDINRQKIERVMSVIRKLSIYLNNLFEDNCSSEEVVVAKHIHGDDSNDLIGDDLDKLIAEFSNKD